MIAQEIGINPSTVQRRIKKMGYTYDNSTKEWSWAGVGEEPVNEDIADKVTRQPHDNVTTTESQQSDNTTTPVSEQQEQESTPARQVNNNVTTPKRQQRNNVTTTSAFTEEEIRLLKELVATQKQKKPQQKGTEEPLHERIKGLVREEKARKNVFLNKGASERLEEFCKSERVNQSDIIELALEDFISKYR
ncbi:hypothetical protein OCD65_28065 [Bacillus paranthracis]|uniref:AsnC family protein n=1 Tax=Bacillus paranthracis TaxID=2026186 RepID=UPI0021D0BE67|nr:AsnC family protein [Bacillus paranthracis]MCU5020538.1 hypothetical protein [Bacillus paranthracis]